MEEIFPKLLIDLLTISVTFSLILMILIQKFKTLKCMNSSYKIWLLNLIFSFILGVPFAMHFYSVNLIDGLWAGLFSFIGAASIYKALKNQKIINYKPISISDDITINKKNEIKREEV